MRFCIIGLKWGKNYIKNLEALGQTVTSICSRNPATVPDEFKKYKHVTRFTDIETASIDVACICTPPKDHFEMAKYFIGQGKHVIIEKPFVFSLREAVEIKELATKHRVSVLVSYQYLWNEGYLICAQQFKGATEKLTITNRSAGNVARDDYSFLWDYSSHDLAMAYGVIGIPADVTINQLDQGPGSFYYSITADGHVINSSFSFSDKKIRQMHIQSDKLSASFEDDYLFNALRAMLAAYVQQIESGEVYTNINLAMAVTKTLCALENHSRTVETVKQSS